MYELPVIAVSKLTVGKRGGQRSRSAQSRTAGSLLRCLLNSSVATKSRIEDFIQQIESIASNDAHLASCKKSRSRTKDAAGAKLVKAGPPRARW